MENSGRSLTIAFIAGLAIAGVRWTVFPDNRWWNLMMAGMPLVVLGLYLLREHRYRR